MQARLKIKALGTFPSVEISEDTFLRLKVCRKNLAAAFSLEEAYDIVIENQLDLEKEVLSNSAENMLRKELDYERLQQTRSTLARRIANLLTTTKVYIDQAPRLAREICGASMESLSQYFSVEYDSHISYRFMSAYRNYVQHYSVSLHQLTIGGARDKETRNLAYETIPWATRQELQKDGSFKKAVLAELPDRINILEMARGYVAAICRIHHGIRSLTDSHLDAARETILTAQDEYRQHFDESIVGLHAQWLAANGKVEDEVSLSLEWDDARLWLAKRSKPVGDLERHYVTSEIASS